MTIATFFNNDMKESLLVFLCCGFTQTELFRNHNI